MLRRPSGGVVCTRPRVTTLGARHRQPGSLHALHAGLDSVFGHTSRKYQEYHSHGTPVRALTGDQGMFN